MKKKLIRFSFLWVLFFCVFFLMLAALHISVAPDAAEGELPDNELYPAISFATKAGFYTEDVSVFLNGAEYCEV